MRCGDRTTITFTPQMFKHKICPFRLLLERYYGPTPQMPTRV